MITKMPRLQQDYGICNLSIVEGFFGKHNGEVTTEFLEFIRVYKGVIV